MGIIVGDSAVRRPSGVADSDKAVHLSKVKAAVYLVYLAGPFSYGNFINRKRRYAHAVISAVFHPLEALDEGRRNNIPANDPDN